MRLPRVIALTVLQIFVLVAPVRPQWALAQTKLQCSELFSETQAESPAQPSAFRLETFRWMTAAAALFPVLAVAGGFSGSGGGEGVAAFANPADAKRAHEFILRNEALPAELLQKARIVSLERWEMKKKGLVPFTVKPNASWQEIHQQAMSNIRLVSPIIASRLAQLSQWMEFSNWDGMKNIPALGDAKPSHPLAATDVRIQLAIRLSAGNSKYGEGPAENGLRLKVFFNQPAFDRLEPFDQAMLVLHEQFYALGQAIGHQNSDYIRPMVQLFFSQSAMNWRAETENGIRLIPITDFFKTKMLQGLGDYPVYFSNLEGMPKGTPRSPERHYSVFVELLRELRVQMSSCLKTGQTGRACATAAQLAFASRKDLTEEQAFVFIAYFHIERGLHGLNAESIMNTELSPSDYNKALHLACELVRKNASSLDPALKAVPLAVSYCKLTL